jgi:hypothetical protein
MNYRALILLAAIFVSALIASASPINTITVGPGSSVIDGTSVSFALPSVSGSLKEWVVSDTTNPFLAGDLDFIFQVTESSGSLQTIAITSCCFGIGFDGGITTGYGSSGTETPTSLSTTLVEGLNATSGPEFTFGSGMTVGTSVDLILQTAAGEDHNALLNINGVAEDIEVLGPLPEPRSEVLPLGCIFVVALLVTKRFHVRS